MKALFGIILFILVVLHTACPVIAADTIAVSGQIEMGLSKVDLWDNTVLPDQYLIKNNFNLQLKWQLLDPLQLVIGLDNEWNINQDTGEHTYQAVPKRYYLDYNPKTGTLIRAGKQKITTGCGVFWNPTDFFNPAQGHLKDHSNDEGVEAIYIEQYFMGCTWNVISLPYFTENYACEIGVERVKPGYLAGLNFYNSAATKAFGVNFASNIGDAGVYTEGACYREGEENSWAALIGINYLFDVNHGGMIRLEYCCDQTPSIRQELLGFSINYNPSEKIILGGTFIWNTAIRGVIFVPNCKYIINDNWEFQVKELTLPGPANITYVISLVRFF